MFGSIKANEECCDKRKQSEESRKVDEKNVGVDNNVVAWKMSVDEIERMR